MEINITCGQYANDHYSNLYEGIFIPFNEACIQGNILYPLFSEKFIEERIKCLHTTKEEYLSKLKGILELKDYLYKVNKIHLYFGDDEFCKYNVNILLKYLKQENYKNEILLNIINEETYEIKKTVHIECL